MASRGWRSTKNAGRTTWRLARWPGFAAWLGMLGVGGGWRRKLDRLPMVMMLVTVSTILAQPLGPFLQKELTTDPRVDAIRVVSITRYDRGALVVHRIRTARI